MKNIKLASLAIFILILSITPFFLSNEYYEVITTSSSIIGALSAIITLIIALLLFSKYGVEKSLINKQTEVVFQLLQELKKTRFIITFGEPKGLLQLQLDMLSHEYLNDYKDKHLLFNKSYYDGLKAIWDLAEDVFLPVEITESIRPLMMQSLSGEKETNGYMIVTIPGVNISSENDFSGKLNFEDISMQDFINRWSLVISKTKKWLKEYSNENMNINFDRS